MPQFAEFEDRQEHRRGVHEEGREGEGGRAIEHSGVGGVVDGAIAPGAPDLCTWFKGVMRRDGLEEAAPAAGAGDGGGAGHGDSLRKQEGRVSFGFLQGPGGLGGGRLGYAAHPPAASRREGERRQGFALLEGEGGRA